MNKKHKKIICFGITILAISLVSGFIYGNILNNYRYVDMSNIIGNLANSNKIEEAELMLIIKDNSETNQELGKNILGKYGYSENLFIWKDYARFIVINGICSLIILIGVFRIKHKKDKLQKRRIEELTLYLESVNNGKGYGLVKKEDEYSILEDEIYKTVIELYTEKEMTLKEKEVLKNNLADISHQIKTPITAMMMMVELLVQSLENDAERLYAVEIQKQLDRLNYLVASLLTLSKLDADVVYLKEEDVDVSNLILRTAELIEPIIEEKNQKLIIGGNKSDSDTQIIFNGDLEWSIEALINIIKNCSEHTPEGGDIILNYSENPIFVEITIEDTGEGFKREDIPYLFKRFYKGKNARKDSVGIGLSLAKEILEKQGGWIGAENRDIGGAKFTIKFYKHQK